MFGKKSSKLLISISIFLVICSLNVSINFNAFLPGNSGKEHFLKFGNKAYAEPATSTVANSAYDISGNGGRKLTRLSNGWLVACVAGITDTFHLRWYKSTDNGATWSLLAFTVNYTLSLKGLAICSYGTTVYTLFTGDAYGYTFSYKFDATTVPAVPDGTATPDSGQNTFGSGCSIAVDSAGILHAAWCSKNATYSNSWNIRYSKSTDGGVTWTTPSQLTTYNNANHNATNPCIIINNSNKPVILYEFFNAFAGSDNGIYSLVYNTSWTNYAVYAVINTYLQTSPGAVVSPDGNIHVVWQGTDTADNMKHNIRYGKSTDGGTTWSTAVKLTSGNTQNQTQASVTADKNNNIYVMWCGGVNSTNDYQLRKIVYSGGSWGAISNLTNVPDGSANYQDKAQTCSNYTDFADPPVIWQDNQSSAIRFRGKGSAWTEPTAPTNVQDSTTKVLLHMDGTDGSTTFTDACGKTWTAGGNARISTAQSKFSGASAYFDGVGDYVKTADNVDFQMVNGDFTVDCWTYQTDNAGSGTRHIVFYGNDGNVTAGFEIYFDINGKINAKVNAESTVNLISTNTLSLNIWHHIALVRNSGTLTLYVDGLSVANAAISGSVVVPTINNCFSIGRQYGDNYPIYGPYKGYIDEFRISKGVARWTSNFTPPAQAYSLPDNHLNTLGDTSGNGGRKLIRLSNGWLVASVYDSSTNKILLYKSTDNGANWSYICYAQDNYYLTAGNYAICNYGTTVYLIVSYSTAIAGSTYLCKFNALTVTDINLLTGYLTNFFQIDSGQTAIGSGCSIAVDSNGILHAAWCSKNAAYPNSYNIRYSKSTDGGVTWAAVTQITTADTTGVDCANPCIIVKSNGYPVIIEKVVNTNHYIQANVYNGSFWVNYIVYNSGGASYTQDNPCVTVSPDGNIHVVWQGLDSTDTSKYNIRCSKSTDGGTTWSSALKLTSGNTYDQQKPSITSDINNKLYVYFQGRTYGSYDQIRKIVYDTSWSSINDLTSNNSASAADPSTCANYTSFTSPLIMYRDNQANAIKYSGPSNQAPAMTITSPLPDESFSESDTAFTPSISVSDADNNTLTCKYYIDSETAPRDTKTASNTYTPQTVTFSAINMNALAEGNHTFKFEANDGTVSTALTRNIKVDRSPPVTGVVNVAPADTGITVSGSAADNISGLDSNPYRYTISANISSWTADKSFTQGSLTPNTSYRVTFEAKDKKGHIASTTRNIFTKSQIPVLTVSNITGTTLEISAADNNSRTTRYLITCGSKYISSTGELKEIPVWITLTNKKIKVTGLSSGMTYIFQAKTKNGDGIQTASSAYVQGTTLISLPAVPANITAIPGSISVTITWSAATGATGYEIEADGIIKNNGASTSYVHKGLIPGTQHKYRVRAGNSNGTGSWSTFAASSTTSTVPGAPANITASATNTTITLTWDKAPDSQGYKAKVDNIQIDCGANTFCTKAGLAPATSHTYSVMSRNSAGESSWSGPAAITTFLLDTPGNINTVEEETAITLTWSAVTGAAGYDVEYKDASGNAIVIDGGGSATYIHNGLTSETRYTYRVKAKNASGTSAWSNSITASTLPVRPAVPANISAMTTQEEITVTWDAVPDAAGYDIEPDGAVVDNDTGTTYVHSGLESYSRHTYRVRARSAAIEGQWSGMITVMTLPGKPEAPENIILAASGSIAVITWDNIAGATGYDMEVDGVIVDNGLKTAYTHRRLITGTPHKYRIRTRNITGTGNWSGEIINNTITARCTKGNTVDLGLTASNITDFSRYTLTVTYKPDVMDIADLCTLSPQLELTAGKVAGTDITINEFTPGKIVFIVEKAITPGESWTGIINSIKFKAKVTGGSTITYTVLSKPENEE